MRARNPATSKLTILNSNFSKDKKKGKKAMIAAWGESERESSSDDKSDTKVANLCFIHGT